MKKNILLILSSIFFIFSAAGENELYKIFPTLEYQIQNNFKDNQQENILSLLNNYINKEDDEFILGMKLILQEELFGKYIKIKKDLFKIDGKDNEWKDIPDIIEDEKNDVKNKNADLIEFRCYLDEDYNLYVIHKILGKPLKKENEESFFTRFYTEDGTYVQIAYSWNGKIAFYKINNGSSKIIKFDYQVDEVGEAVIPLGKILETEKIKRCNELIIEGSVYHKEHYDYSKYIYIYQRQINYALKLLVFLLQHKCYLQNDTISMALSLANNYYYSIADKETKEEIEKDLVKHFNFYKKVISRQEEYPVKYDLQKVPVIPKIFWADRKRHMDYLRSNEKMNIKFYKEFIDRIENLDEIFKLAKSLKLEEAYSLKNIAETIETFARDKLIYRTKIERHKALNDEDTKEALKEYKEGKYIIKYFGKERIWSHLHWLNYQMKYYKENNKFKGDCMTATTIQMVLYKAAGIPPLSMQWVSEKKWGYSHNFPFYYNYFLNKWDCIQKPSDNEEKLYQYYIKPIWHHRVYKNDFDKEGLVIYKSYYQGELADLKKIKSLLKRGLEEKEFERIFLSDETQKPGFIFNDRTAPDKIIDTDNDSITDDFEKEKSLDPNNYDTDNDGYTDLWELERGFDPKDNKSPDKFIPAIDGIINNNPENIITEYDPPNDNEADRDFYDIKSVCAGVIGNYLYLGAVYYNDITKNERKVFSFQITSIGKEYNKYWIQWIDDKSYVYRYLKDGDKEKLSEIKELRGLWESAAIKDAEFMIPMSLFNGADKLYIKHYTTGFIKDKKTNSDDRSESIRLALKNDTDIEAIMNNIDKSESYKDKKGDYEAKKNIYDIRSITPLYKDKKIIVYTEYYNDIKYNDFSIHSFDIKDDKRHLFIQTWRKDYCAVWENKEKKELSFNEFDIIPVDDGYLFIIDLKKFNIGDNIKLRYRAGGNDKEGKQIISSDMTDYISLKEY